MKMSYLLSLCVILCLHFSARAQHEDDFWIWGGDPFPTNPPALNFFSGEPVSTVTNPTSTYWSTEAAAAVADSATGALLFYTDAEKVYAADQSLMPNGGATLSTSLSGCNSTTQGALILPNPGKSNHYFIFTLDCSEHFPYDSYSGLQYSEVDMTLNNGLGDVIQDQRNLHLWGPPDQNKLTEKLTATRNKNGTDYWLVAHEWTTNNFLSFAVTCNGVSLTPIVSSVGTIHTSGSSFPEEIIGAMKISPDGTRLALVAGRGEMNIIEIFDFDPGSGIVSNPVTLPANGNDYGVEFSPNGQLLYVSVYNALPCCSGEIFQYDLTAGNDSAIEASKTSLDISATYGYGGMQLGPDNKIYVSRALQTDFLGVIASPDNVGADCDFSTTGPVLSGRRSNIGLINLVRFQPNPNCRATAIEPTVEQSQQAFAHYDKNSSTIQITFASGVSSGPMKILLYNMTGSIVEQKTVPRNENDNIVSLSVPQEQGIYFLRITDENSTPLLIEKLLLY